jgi:hypothetical protein
MEEAAILRYTPKAKGARLSELNFKINLYPFTTLPLLRSHLHPKFVIFDAGRKLSKYPAEEWEQLELSFMDTFNISLDTIGSLVTLYTAWTRELTPTQQNDPSFN